MQSPEGSPALSPARSGRSSRASSRASNLSLDMTAIHSHPHPAEPTNTLIITGLSNPDIFHPQHLYTLRETINASAPIVHWSPLKSLQRLIITFPTADDARDIRGVMDNKQIMDSTIRVYYGKNTPVEPVDQHLQAPESKKLFFISPPPSPPMGWEQTTESAPNAVVVAEDLAHALSKLSVTRKQSKVAVVAGDTTDVFHIDAATNAASPGGSGEHKVIKGRSRSSSILLFEPQKEDEKKMPAISVEDFSDEEAEPEPEPKPLEPVPKTARPPVELMA